MKGVIGAWGFGMSRLFSPLYHIHSCCCIVIYLGTSFYKPSSVMMSTNHMARSLCCQGVSRVLSASFFYCLLFLRRLTFKTISDLALIKVMDHLNDVTCYADIIFSKTESLSVNLNIMMAITDLLIVGTLCTLLNHSHTGFQR